MTTTEFLALIGFAHFTGPLWKHEKYGLMSFEGNETPEKIVHEIYQRGWGECQAIIKGALGIVPGEK